VVNISRIISSTFCKGEQGYLQHDHRSTSYSSWSLVWDSRGATKQLFSVQSMYNERPFSYSSLTALVVFFGLISSQFLSRHLRLHLLVFCSLCLLSFLPYLLCCGFYLLFCLMSQCGTYIEELNTWAPELTSRTKFDIFRRYLDLFCSLESLVGLIASIYLPRAVKLVVLESVRWRWDFPVLGWH